MFSIVLGLALLKPNFFIVDNWFIQDFMNHFAMPIHLNIPKRYSDPAPYVKDKNPQVPDYARSVPDLRVLGKVSPCASPSRSPQGATPKTTPTASPAEHYRYRSSRHRRQSYTGAAGGQNVGYFSMTPRRATDPSTSPRRFRRGTCWMEDEPDPWTLFRQKWCHTVPNGDDKLFGMDMDSQAAASLGCYRLRSFSVTSKGVVNLGDFFRERSHSDASVTSDESSSGVEFDFRDRLSSVESTTSSTCFRYKVLLLGAEEVGKTSLVAQFMTSECLTTIACAIQTSIDGSQEKRVSLLVDGEETELTCEDPTNPNFEVDDSSYYCTDAFLVVYSVTDRKSLNEATNILLYLRELGSRCRSLYPDMGPKVMILVANKIDLVRCRVVTTEDGHALADRYDLKYIETSVGFNHKVDELLVGIVTQIRLKAQQVAQRTINRNLNTRSAKLSSKARVLVDRILQKCDLKTRSCDNLHVL